jgi:hypothetical protein
MFMTYRRFKYEGWLYGLAFLLALGLRLIQLGALPLTDAEAESALQALRIAQGLKPAIAPHPLYILLTAPAFFILGGGTNFLARLLPVLAGSALVFAPMLFRERLKPRPSLILAFFLALDPGLMTLSREAASSIFAITFLLFAWGFWINNRARLAGAFLALALLSGPAVWAGLLALGIAWAIRQGLEAMPVGRKQPTVEDQPEAGNEAVSVSPSAKTEYRPALISFGVTFLIAGSLFFMVPTGLGAAVASLPEYLRGWSIFSNVPSSRLFISLLVYQPLAVLLAILAIGRGWMRASRRIVPLSLWLLVALLLAVFYPAHQVGDLAWALIPLYALAALELARYFDIHPEERNEVLGVMVLVLFIIAFAWLDLASYVWVPIGTQQSTLRLWLFVGSLFLLVLSILLVAAGWSVRVARFGAIHGLAIALGVFSFGGALGSIGLRGTAFPEMWWPPSRPAQADMLAATVNDLSEWGFGEDHAAPVVILKVDSPALEWALRDHVVTMATALDPADAPAIVLTSTEIDPSLASSYRGQDFTWRQTPAWETLQRESWVRWIVLRELPQNGEITILWARDDLFLDSPARTFP